MKKFFGIIFSRLLYTLLFVAVQGAALYFVLRFFETRFVWFYAAGVLLSVLTGLHVISSGMNPAYKIAWLVPILLLPIFGGLMYLMFGTVRTSAGERRRMQVIGARYRAAMAPHAPELEALAAADPDAGLHARYLTHMAGCAPWRATATRYLPLGEDYFAAMTAQLRQAKKFIFLEYFIIEEGRMWDEILAILEEKVRQGVDVRVLYDDLGCLFTLPRRYDRTLARRGIRTCVFHRFNSILNSRFNTRDHRKICVVDGDVGFTGGVNLADEYINAVVKHGHWKDTGIELRGQAVFGLTTMFLSVWDYLSGDEDDFAAFAPSAAAAATPDDGAVLPYTDTPFDDEPVGETVYMNLINRARRYVWITTPYLIIDNEMMTALRTAARAGVDVRIITPGIADKKAVKMLTRSHYEPLLRAGVRIFEYTPGFIHAKTFVCDDRYAVVGTINLDYRSLYLHYEDAVWMAGSSAVAAVRDDYLATLTRCHEVTPDEAKTKNAFARLGLAVLRAFAPLM